MMHQQQSQAQKRILKFSIMQIQLLNLLQLTSQQVESKIESELEENPALEEGTEEQVSDEADAANEEEPDLSLAPGEEKEYEEPEFNIEEYMDEEYIPQYKTQSNN